METEIVVLEIRSTMFVLVNNFAKLTTQLVSHREKRKCFQYVLHISNVRLTSIYMLACQLVCLFGLFTMYPDYYLVPCCRRHGFTVKNEKILGQGKVKSKGKAERQKTEICEKTSSIRLMAQRAICILYF